MKIKYKFSLSQDWWISDNVRFVEHVFERNGLDMSQILDILDDFEIFTSKCEAKKEIVYRLVQNERTLIRYGEGCVDDRTMVFYANLSRHMNNDERNVANNYAVGFDDENWYSLRAEITPTVMEE